MNRDIGNTYKKENCTRKSNKQIMEKRRRARINTCLAQLKSLVLQGTNKEDSQYAKLEKADILEMTVTYLNNAKNMKQTASTSPSPDNLAKYRAGFNECAQQAFKYIGSASDIDSQVRVCLMEHLADYLQTKRDSPVSTPRSPSPCTMNIKREVISPTMEDLRMPELVHVNQSTQPLCMDLGRCSPEIGDTFPNSLGRVVQSLSLNDFQTMTSLCGNQIQSPMTSELSGTGQEQSAIFAGAVVPFHNSDEALATEKGSMWRPW